MSDLRHFDIIRSPVVTEKAIAAGEYNKYTFQVEKSASKPEIKAAVEELFKVKVTKINVIVTKGKTKRFRGIAGKQSDVKKAVVTLGAGQSIDTTTGL